MKIVNRLFVLPLAAFFLGVGIASAQSGLQVTINSSRSQDDVYSQADDAVKRFSLNFAKMSAKAIENLRRSRGIKSSLPITIPVPVQLYQNGVPLPPPNGTTRGGGPLLLSFDTTGSRAFPSDYRAFLQSVFDKVQPTLDIVFGTPSVGGTVKVSNFNEDIGRRDAIAGGYYLVNNGSGVPEIRFPIYNSAEAAAVNLIHCLLLAYLGPNQYPFDAFNEGLVRAATMKIVRTPGSLPSSLDKEVLESVLESTYDVGTFYDWYNQRALAGPTFMAANLRNAALPDGGSLGGIYLLRYQMAGSVWQKVLVEFPAFISTFNNAYYASPSQYNTADKLAVLAQSVLNSLKGGNGSVEGLGFAPWMRRQFILNTRLTPGLKLLNQPFPITSGLGGNDFGVFGVQATWFQTFSTGDELLLSGTCFPIYWTPDFLRIFTTAQDEQMDITGAYGSVAPNFTSDLFGNKIYCVAVDLPVQDQISRVYLPAGAIATAGNSNVSNLYGTLVGGASSATYVVRVSWGNETPVDVSVINGAFGLNILTDSFVTSQILTIKVLDRTNADNVVLFRQVNKGPGSIALDLRIAGDTTFNFGTLPGGVSMFGTPFDSYISYAPDLLGVDASQLLTARWNSVKVKYELFPDVEGFTPGHSHFVRLPASIPFLQVEGRTSPDTPIAVALRPGWNMITNPLADTVNTGSVQVVVARDNPQTFADSRGVVLGTDFFEFTPGSTDPKSGVPEGGTMTAATSFQPGKGYFIRVLSPDGATLLFSPSGRSTQGRSQRSKTKTPRWTLALELTTSDGEQASAVIGQARLATRSFDRFEDSTLPPLVGGLQISIQGKEGLYRDMRAYGRAETYKLNLTGLIPGKQYTLQMNRNQGNLNGFTLSDPYGSGTRSYGRSGSYTFVASKPSQTLAIGVKGW